MLGIPIWLGAGTTAALAAAVAVVCVLEYARLADLPRAEVTFLIVLAVAHPVAAWLRPELLALVPVLMLACALTALLGGDAQVGLRRAAFTAFGSVWLCWALANLVLVGSNAFLVCFAAARADVAAWSGARGCGVSAGPGGPCRRSAPTRQWAACSAPP